MRVKRDVSRSLQRSIGKGVPPRPNGRVSLPKRHFWFRSVRKSRAKHFQKPANHLSAREKLFGGLARYFWRCERLLEPLANHFSRNAKLFPSFANPFSRCVKLSGCVANHFSGCARLFRPFAKLFRRFRPLPSEIASLLRRMRGRAPPSGRRRPAVSRHPSSK
jgi:hypothetical protein